MSRELYFNSIFDMPLLNWILANEKDDFSHCRINKSKGTDKEDVQAFKKITESFVDRYGFSENFMRIMDIKTEIALLQCEMVIEDDRFLINMIRRLQKEIEQLEEPETKKQSIFDLIPFVGKWNGSMVKYSDTTVAEFYDCLEAIKKSAKKTKKNG